MMQFLQPLSVRMGISSISCQSTRSRSIGHKIDIEWSERWWDVEDNDRLSNLFPLMDDETSYPDKSSPAALQRFVLVSRLHVELSKYVDTKDGKWKKWGKTEWKRMRFKGSDSWISSHTGFSNRRSIFRHLSLPVGGRFYPASVGDISIGIEI